MIVTQESNPTLWQSLHNIWVQEKLPGWVVTGSQTYQVVQNVAGEIEFHEQTTRSLYESTSFRN
jgi:hypothetical protein